jgi:CheY-like chemotaxis protein
LTESPTVLNRVEEFPHSGADPVGVRARPKNLPDARGRLASEILELFAKGAFSFWHWIPEVNSLTTHGSLMANSIEDWMICIHPRDLSEFSRFLDQDWKESAPVESIEYRFNPDRQGNWIRVRQTAGYSGRSKDGSISSLIEILTETGEAGESSLETMAGEWRRAESELIQFVDSAVNLGIQPDPAPVLKLLQKTIGADAMMLVHFGSSIIVTDSLAESNEGVDSDRSGEYLPLIEAIAELDKMDQSHPFELDLEETGEGITHYIVKPLLWGEGVKGALCAGFLCRERRGSDAATHTRLSLISAFADGQLDRLRRLQMAGSRSVVTQPAAPPQTIPEGGSRRSRLASQDLKGVKVLLVEDESAVRKLVRKLLELLGCTVTEAASGRHALDLWPSISGEIRLVVSDIVMPEEVSGWDLARELHGLHPELGILLTSGYGEVPADHGLGGIPRIAFLQKPYGVKTLKETLMELIAIETGS